MADERKKSVAFFERGSWYHRTKTLNEDYTVKYGKIGGFKTEEEAIESYKTHMENFEKELTAHHFGIDKEIMLLDYLKYWFECIFKERELGSTYELGVAYIIYNFIVPALKHDNESANIKLKYCTADYFNSLLDELAKITDSAGNKCKEVLNIAMKDAVENNLITKNPLEYAKSYPRKKPKIKILRAEEIKKLLDNAYFSNWYLEIILGMFCGLRKGEIMGLKFSDFDESIQAMKIQRELINSPKIVSNPENESVKVENYKLIEMPPKKNSYRTLKIPKFIFKILHDREKLYNMCKEQNTNFKSYGYVSFQEKNGLPHTPSALNSYLYKACPRLNITQISVHGLRHICATILIERGVPIEKIAAFLGHSSPNTTFEVYCDVMEERDKILNLINDIFPSRDKETA